MSSLIPSGSASGTGSMTLAAPVTNSNQTATLPDASGTVMVSGNMPAFRATMSASQTINNNTYTKVNFNTATYDTNSNYNTSTYRFTPTVAGYYKMDFNLGIAATAGRTYAFAPAVYKNSSSYSTIEFDMLISASATNVNVPYSDLIYMNGSTDYLEAYFYQYDFTATSTIVINNANQQSKVTCFLARGA